MTAAEYKRLIIFAFGVLASKYATTSWIIIIVLIATWLCMDHERR